MADDNEQRTTPSRARERSPSYPSITPTEALGLARKMWEKEKRTTVPPEIAARAFGFGALSGNARQAIASMRQYGLIENDAGGVRLSATAMTALHHPEGSTERTEAVRRIAMNPPLIRELAATYREASDDSLRAHLITVRHFAEEGAGRFIKAFRNAISLANPDSPGYNSDTSGSGETPKMDAAAAAIPQAGKQRVSLFSWPLSKGVTAEVRFIGDGLQPAHIERLRQYLDLAKEAVGSEDESD